MLFPFQCLVARSQSATGSDDWVLFGASGSKLVAQSSTGTTSIWPQQSDHTIDDQDDELEERPGKRIKLSPSSQDRKSHFSHLILSDDGQYLIGVTGEDKCIRVFQIDSQNRIVQLSERCMSRRPSSIALASDDSVILCADKFGDVYALPLLPGPEDDAKPEIVTVEQPDKQNDFTPAASVLTVHSGRNRKTLEEQLKQKAKAPPKPKEAATFKHDLLLGHVSMLTDLVYVKKDNRSYIITADRDEHIRISRGQPQAHIIEGFCFGHEQFVSQLCVTKSGLLVSGGGDADVYVWNWQNYKLLEQLPLRNTALQYLQSHSGLAPAITDEPSFKTAVSGIWDIPSYNDESRIMVACEGLPALFVFSLNVGATSGTAIPLSGNALSVTVVRKSQSSSCMAVVSVDNVYKSGSTTEFRDENDAARLQILSDQGNGQWHEDASAQAALEWFVRQGPEVLARRADDGHATDGKAEACDVVQAGSADDKAVRDILYSVENLRKRPGAED